MKKILRTASMLLVLAVPGLVSAAPIGAGLAAACDCCPDCPTDCPCC